jgi:tripartite-type tricarboxylate transporter receptor subunit TctC
MVSGNKIAMKNIVSWLKAVLFATALITSSFAHASYPDKPIRIIVTFVAGGGADVLARYMAKEMAEVLGQPVVVENRTGAGGLIGVEAGLAAAPDGYTLTLISSSYTVNPSLYKLKFDPLKDITPVVRVSAGPMLAVTSTKSGIKTVPELIAAAKKAPGAINFASSGQGSVIHLANELFNQRADIKMTHIPYKGGGNALVDLIANQVDLYFAATASALPHVRTGKINAVAVTTPDRIQALPNVPTIAESGFPGYEATLWYGLIGPKGMPNDIVQKLNLVVNDILKKPAAREKIQADGAEPAGGSSAEFLEIIGRETQIWGKVVRDIGIQPQ